jgi:hypothetical protein
MNDSKTESLDEALERARTIQFDYRKHDSKCEGPDPLCRCVVRFTERKKRLLDAMAGTALGAHDEFCVYRESNRTRPCSCALSRDLEDWPGGKRGSEWGGKP